LNNLLNVWEYYLANTCAIGPGWRWFCWVCTIFTGLNFLAVLLFVPGTRFVGDVDQSLVGANVIADNESGEKQIATEDNKLETTVSTINPKKTWTQELNPWSGIDNTTSYLGLCVRPFPLLAYPAFSWAILGCNIYI